MSLLSFQNVSKGFPTGGQWGDGPWWSMSRFRWSRKASGLRLCLFRPSLPGRGRSVSRPRWLRTLADRLFVTYPRDSSFTMLIIRKGPRGWICAAMGFLLVLVLAGVAKANWGNGKCSLSVHCYAVTNLSGTHAKGVAAYNAPVGGPPGGIVVESANVPEYEEGAFVDDEVWLSFPDGGWLETGLTAGYNVTTGGSCCTLHPFIAHAVYVNGHGVQGYEEYTWVYTEAYPTYQAKIEDPEANGDWCEYIFNAPSTWVNVDCHSKGSYWPDYASDLEGGEEAASNNTRVYNGARQEVAEINSSGTWVPWYGSVSETVNGKLESVAGVMCIRPNPYSNYPGNAQYWAC
jgi:hypothetical protein